MNLESQIRAELWAAIAGSYQTENYSHAIKDAMVLVTETLRDKSGLDGDGDTLAGKALGFSEGKSPLIRINKLQTQSEQDEQKGFLLVIKGMYALIRNPRSHERLDDTRDTADKIILFIDYLLGFLGASQQSFTIQGFITAITEPHFVKDQEYVEELINTIPVRKLSDTVIAAFRGRNWKLSDNFELVIPAVLAKLDDAQIADFLSVVSDDLMRMTKLSEITLVLKILPNTLWSRVQKMPKLRAENMFLEELSDAWYIPEKKETNSPACTWIDRIVRHFSRKSALQDVVTSKFLKDDFDQHNFVAAYMMPTLIDLFQDDWEIARCVGAIAQSIRAGNVFVKNKVTPIVKTTNGPK